MRPLLGSHVSAAGGYDKALERGEAIGAEVIQVFVSSPRSWNVTQPTKEKIDAYKAALKKSSIKKVYVHGSYLVNLGTPNKELYEKSARSLKEEFQATTTMGFEGLIFHVGSIKDQKVLPVKQIAKAIKDALKAAPGKSQIIMENAAGGGGKIGSQFEDFVDIMKVVDSSRLKVCYDTAHGFEAGLIGNYVPKEIDKLLKYIDKTVGLKNLVALHINDSKTPFNSRNDRHENLGKGYIGLSGFKNLGKEKRLAKTAWMLEVPGFDDMGPDKKNMDLLKSCFS